MHAILEAFKPDPFLEERMIKWVSDLADKDMTMDKETRQRYAATKAAQVALRVIGHFRRCSSSPRG
jgi:hypothetical protein